MKNIKNDKQINAFFKYIPLFIYILCFVLTSYLLYNARQSGLLGIPIDGMDQLSILKAAVGLFHGKLPQGHYHYSYTYTIFLYLTVLLSNGNLFIMRLLQAALCAFVPVIIYKLSLKIGFGVLYSSIASLLYCFYGPTILISLSFLRAVSLGLCFILFVYLVILAYEEKKLIYYLLSGLFASLCILGRENFIPVVMMPLIFLFFLDVRRQVKYKYLILGTITALFCVFVFVFFNYIRYDSFAIIPGHVSNIIGAYHGNAQKSGELSKVIMSILSNIPTQLGNFVSSYEIPNSVSFYAHRDILNFLYLLFIPFNLLFALSASALVLVRRNKYILLLFLFVICYIFTMIFFDMFYRFRIPVVPLMCIISTFTIKKIINNWNKKRVLSLCLILISLFLFFQTNIDPNEKRPYGERLSAVKILTKQKRFNEAELKLKEMNPELQAVKQAWIELCRNRGY